MVNRRHNGFCLGLSILILLAASPLAFSQSAGGGASSTAAASAPAKPVGTEIAPGVVLQLRELKRTPRNTLVLKFNVKNNTAAAYKMETYYAAPAKAKGDESGGREFSAIKLVETATQKEHTVMVGSDGHRICSRGSVLPKVLKPGESFTYWAQFEDLPLGVTSVKVVFSNPPIAQVLPIT
jgi:hypothetical protein